jgi:hypothetical protein
MTALPVSAINYEYKDDVVKKRQIYKIGEIKTNKYISSSRSTTRLWSIRKILATHLVVIDLITRVVYFYQNNNEEIIAKVSFCNEKYSTTGYAKIDLSELKKAIADGEAELINDKSIYNKIFLKKRNNLA